MATEAIYKLQPHRTMSLRGFDRRGASASLNNASSSGFKVTGHWSDQADFAVLMLHDSDDVYGHLQTTKYLPDTNMTGVTLDFDLALSGCFSPTSVKFDSINAGQLSYIAADETSGVKPLAACMTATTGGSPAKKTFTIAGTIALNDLFYIIYLGNYQTLYQAPALATPTSVASGLTFGMNTSMQAGLSITPFAVWNGATGLDVYAGRSAVAALFTLAATTMTLNTGSMTAAQAAVTGFWGLQVGDVVMFTNGVGMEKHTIAGVTSPWQVTLDSAVVLASPTIAAWPLYQADGNTVQLYVATASIGGSISPSGAVKLAGGASETSLHLRLDFSVGLTSLRQAWLTLGATLNVDTTTNNATLQAFAQTDFSAQFTNWSAAGANLALEIAGPGSVTVGSRDSWCKYGGAGWTEQPDGNGNFVLSGDYYKGFSKVSATTGDSVTVTYSCQQTHDVYVGAAMFTSSGIFHATVDGVAQADVDMYANAGVPVVSRRLVKASVPAGTHVVVLSVSAAKNAGSSGYNCVFDYLQAAVRTDVQDPSNTYSGVNVAMDYDTDQTYKISPARALWIIQRMGYTGDIDFYAGVFFALRRQRLGGSFHSATVTAAGIVVNGDSCFLNIAGTSIGIGVTSVDSLTSIAQRFVDAINALFVGVWAAPTVTAGQFLVTVQSPINGFTIARTSGASVTLTIAGDLGFGPGSIVGGNEGTWQVDSSQASPLNKAFVDYFTDFCTIVAANSWTTTCAFSQELLNPPDANTSGGAWVQRFANGVPVLTSTGFGSWGAGVVEANVSSTITQTGHGYVTGNIVSIANGSNSGAWSITVTDSNHYQLTTLVAGGYTPAAGDQSFVELQTAQCAFSSNVSTYLGKCHYQAAGVMNTVGLVPWLQFGEVLHWFFPYVQSLALTTVANSTPVAVATSAAHGFSTGQTVILAGVQGSLNINGRQVITVTGSTTFTVNGSSGAGTWTGGGTVTGGGMALYDADQSAAAVSSLGRSLASFYTQDDDPTINSSADANFLAGRVKSYCDAIRTYVLGGFASAKFELLFPYDVCYPSCYFTADMPWPQGGRLNRAINMPSAWSTKTGSGLDRMKMEGLSWSATYHNSDKAKETVRFPYTILSWAKADTRYLIPWFNGGCCWAAEYLFCKTEQTPGINFWAFDHAPLFDWPVNPLPSPKKRITSR